MGDNHRVSHTPDGPGTAGNNHRVSHSPDGPGNNHCVCHSPDGRGTEGNNHRVSHSPDGPENNHCVSHSPDGPGNNHRVSHSPDGRETITVSPTLKTDRGTITCISEIRKQVTSPGTNGSYLYATETDRSNLPVSLPSCQTWV